MGQWLLNLTGFLALLSEQGSGAAASRGAGCRHGSGLALLWCRLTATALIQPLAWELPYALSAALKR